MVGCRRYPCGLGFHVRLRRIGALKWVGQVGGLLKRAYGVSTMQRSKGQRQGTRYILKRSKSERGRLNIARVMHQYAVGDRVAVVLDGGQQKGMPHRRFNGRSGRISGQQGRAWVVKLKDGNMRKTVVARPDHLRPIE